jgi:hypothetical protein
MFGEAAMSTDTMTERTQPLIDAIATCERRHRETLETLRDLDADDAWKLREAIELVGCLRRLVAGSTVTEIYKAFGAPGDFGYDTPIGAALAKFYRGEG